jgi:hypothetical protein
MARPRLRDDYDDDRGDYGDSRPPPDISSGMSTVKIVAIIAGVVLCVALMCGGLAFYAIHSVFSTAEKLQERVVQQVEKIQKEQERLQKEQENSDKEKSRQFANGFVQELRGQRGEAAYAMTTAAYQKRVSLEQLKELMARQAAVLRRFSGFFADVLAPNQGATFTFSDSIARGGKQHKLSVTAVKEGAGWKVDRFAVEDDEQGPKGS